MKDLRKYKKIIVETDEKTPEIIAVITSDTVETTDKYRVRLAPTQGDIEEE